MNAVTTVLLATDLRPSSDAATAEALAAAHRLGARLMVLCVVDPRVLRLPGGGFRGRVDQQRERVMPGLQAIVARAHAQGTAANLLVWQGDPAETIVAAAEAEDAGLIVLGTSRRGTLGRWMHPSVSARVALASPGHVMVVDPDGMGHPALATPQDGSTIVGR